jgi:site-specific DNA-methyltransferase (adenine-specific)
VSAIIRVDYRLGAWEEVLAGVTAQALIADPPYGERTHSKQRHGRKEARYTGGRSAVLAGRGLPYAHWEPDDVRRFVEAWVPRVSGWMVCFTSHDLVEAYERAYAECGLYAYAPVSAVQLGMNVRLAGDGPSNWTTYILRARHRNPLFDHLMVARPRWPEPWGTLPGAHVGKPFDSGENMLDRSARPTVGAKPLWLMRELVLAYSRPGDTVVDPCAGRGTTLVAAALEGRRGVGSELDPRTHAGGQLFIDGGFRARAEQGDLFAGDRAGALSDVDAEKRSDDGEQEHILRDVSGPAEEGG